MIVRWGLEELPGLLDDIGIDRPLLVANERWDHLAIPAPHRWTEIPSDRISVPPDADGILAVGGGSAIDPDVVEQAGQLLEAPADDHCFSCSCANTTNACAAALPERPAARRRSWCSRTSS